MNLNKAELIGNLTADPTVKKLQSGSTVAAFTVATSRSWKMGDEAKKEVEFHPVVAWGQLAQVVARYLKKGDKVYVDGRLKTTRFQGKRGGVAKTEVVAQNLILLGGAQDKSKSETNDAVIVEEVDPEKV